MTARRIGSVSNARAQVSVRLRRGKELYRRTRLGARTLRARVEALEAEVQEQRQLNRRIAELTDVVAELLIPIADRNEEQARTLLEDYRKNLV